MDYLVQRAREATGFQTPTYAPDIDLRTDAVFVYGANPQLPERIAAWRAQGYRVHFMTGVAWGHYDESLRVHSPTLASFPLAAYCGV